MITKIFISLNRNNFNLGIFNISNAQNNNNLPQNFPLYKSKSGDINNINNIISNNQRFLNNSINANPNPSFYIKEQNFNNGYQNQSINNNMNINCNNMMNNQAGNNFINPIYSQQNNNFIHSPNNQMINNGNFQNWNINNNYDSSQQQNIIYNQNNINNFDNTSYNNDNNANNNLNNNMNIQNYKNEQFYSNNNIMDNNKINIIRKGNFLNNEIVLNDIYKICINNFKEKDSHKTIAEELKKKYQGEWFVAFEADKNEYEFKFSEASLDDILIFKYKEKNIYIYKYI